jgi:hypothetical protein
MWLIQLIQLLLPQVLLQHIQPQTLKNGFAIALELELWNQRSDVMLSGMNNLSQQVALNIIYQVWAPHLIH